MHTKRNVVYIRMSASGHPDMKEERVASNGRSFLFLRTAKKWFSDIIEKISDVNLQFIYGTAIKILIIYSREFFDDE